MKNKYLIQYEDWNGEAARPRLKKMVKIANFTDKQLENFCNNQPNLISVTTLQINISTHNSVKDTVRK